MAEVLDNNRVIVMQESYDSHFVSDVLYHNYAAKTSDSETTSEDEETQQIPDESPSEATATTMEHNYIVMESPKSLKRRFETHVLSVEEKLDSCRKRLKLEKEKTKRLIRVNSLSEVISELKQKSLISSGCAEMLEVRSPECQRKFSHLK